MLPVPYVRLEASVAREALHHFSLHFIRKLLPRESEVALSLPCGLAIVCLSDGIEDAARKTTASSNATGQHTRKTTAYVSVHGPTRR
jgi:hypothetical protein